ncbi:MAG: hypothetical protein ACJ72W_08375, partial [Actinoallomurus sp.]
MITYRATLDVSRELVRHVARLLWAERRRRATPRGSRALTCFWQAVLVLRWFRDRTDPTALGRDHGVSRATAYRYIDEVIEVLAACAPDLHAALQRAKDDGLAHLITDGTIIESDRCREPAGLGARRLEQQQVQLRGGPLPLASGRGETLDPVPVNVGYPRIARRVLGRARRCRWLGRRV